MVFCRINNLNDKVQEMDEKGEKDGIQSDKTLHFVGPIKSIAKFIFGMAVFSVDEFDLVQLDSILTCDGIRFIHCNYKTNTIRQT